MPDPGMPYGDQFNSTPGMQYGQNIPSPTSQMLDYAYLQNNQTLMNQGQSNIQQTMATAQYNFHRDMQTVLQGTMAAGMALYNTGKSAVDKSRERMYQDSLLSQGNYVLERSAWREMSWASGLAGSDFGRALKIGGRQPEFMSQAELEFQMSRSWHHRMDELGIQAGGGVVAAGSSLFGMGLTGGFGGLMKPMGLIKGSLVGMAIDQTLGRFYDVGIAQPAEYRRKFQEMTEITDLNAGVGQRRLTNDTSNRLSGRFYERDEQPWARYIPLVGDAIANRLAPNTKGSDIIPKMMQAGLFRDQNLNDVDSMEKFVKDTIKVVEKFAGLANTTKDSILGLKAKFNNLGFNNLQQNTMIGNIVTTSMSTGLDVATISGYAQGFQSLGFNTGMNKSIVGQSGLLELASNKSLIEAGLIDRNLDPGSLSAHNLQNAIQQGKTGWGTVNRFGGNNASLSGAAAYLASQGGGSTAAGFMAKQLGLSIDDTDPIKNFNQTAINTYKRLRESGHSEYEAYIGAGNVMGLDGSPEKAAQFRNAILGGNEIGTMLSAGSIARKESDRTGDKTKLNTFSLNDLINPMNSLSNRSGLAGDFEKFYRNISNQERYESGSDSESYYKAFRSVNGDKVKQMYNFLLQGDLTNADKIKQEIIKDSTKRKGLNGGYGSGTGNSFTPEIAEKNLALALLDLDKEGYGEKSSLDSVRQYLGLGGGGESKDRRTKNLKEAINTLASNDPRNFGVIDSSNVSDKAKSAFAKLISRKENQDTIKYLYNNISGNSTYNQNLFLRALSDERLEGLGLSKDEADTLVRQANLGKEGAAALFAPHMNDLSSDNNMARRHAFLNLKTSSNNGSYKDIGFDEYNRVTGQLGMDLKSLRNLDSKGAREWLQKNKQGFLYNAEAATGSKTFAERLLSGLDIMAKAGDKEYKNYVNQEWFKNPSINTTNLEDAAKAVGYDQENPNTTAVKALTEACKALTGAIGK
jgi:hypothetical protein